MKTKTFLLLAGVGAPLILTGTSHGGFLGIKAVGKANPYGLLVCNVYAIFDRPGEDRMSAVAGTPNTPLQIDVFGGVFYNHAFGGNLAPSAVLVDAFPSLAYDSFVTIGVKIHGEPGGQPENNTVITPGYPPIEGAQKYTTTGGWAVTPIDAQGDPFDPVNSYPGNGQILIAQYSTADGFAIAGQFLIQVISNGTTLAVPVSFYHVPSPGVLPLLGVAGLIGAKRRRVAVLRAAS